MQRTSVTQTGVGSSNWLPVNCEMLPMNIGFGCIVSGTVNYTVEHCFDYLGPASAGGTGGIGTAFPHPFVAAQTTSKDGNYAMPVSAIRVTVNSGSGSVTLKYVQGGGRP